MNHFIYVKTKTYNKDRLLVKLYKNNISVFHVEEKNGFLYLKIRKEDFAKIKKLIVTTKFIYVRDSGIFHLKNLITPLKIFCLVFFLFALFFLSHIIIEVDVIHSNKEIRELVRNRLEDYGIQKNTFKKNYEELNKIKAKILADYRNQLEWLEIETIGMKYVVRIEERVINQKENSENYCHIVARKSGVLESIRNSKGEIVKNIGTYVNEGDILISGEVKYNEEVKQDVCARGTALAEVWYTTIVHLPIEYIETTRTGKMRYNFLVRSDKDDYKIFRSRLKTYETEEDKLFSLWQFSFYKLKEYEIDEEQRSFDLEAGVMKAISLADEKIKMKLKGEERIKTRKVLKKSINNSTIDVEIFYSVIEDIGQIQEYNRKVEEEVR